MKKGFTLIELVMVIVIISILAAIAIPKFIDLRNNAKQAACDGNLATIRSALAAYYAKVAAEGGSAEFPPTLHYTAFKQDFFADGTLPKCAFDSDLEYTYDSDAGVVSSHDHL